MCTSNMLKRDSNAFDGNGGQKIFDAFKVDGKFLLEYCSIRVIAACRWKAQEDGIMFIA
ncbi:hypothetical protein Pint_01606 [Pistacia integerrima]|uniref:Uncharacterized protein n=1 Tax=Pistacia integerrima TaxID=434235 RepID=A0ACC0ZNC3_9ROSI|nr:hypothetical protein Pint_01606 [Pistacia integerrima]